MPFPCLHATFVTDIPTALDIRELICQVPICGHASRDGTVNEVLWWTFCRSRSHGYLLLLRLNSTLSSPGVSSSCLLYLAIMTATNVSSRQTVNTIQSMLTSILSLLSKFISLPRVELRSYLQMLMLGIQAQARSPPGTDECAGYMLKVPFSTPVAPWAIRCWAVANVRIAHLERGKQSIVHQTPSHF